MIESLNLRIAYTRIIQLCNDAQYDRSTIIIGCSGGKDSTLVFLLCCLAVKNGVNPSVFEVVHSDTRMEIPQIYLVSNRLKEIAKFYGIKFTTVSASPNRGFFYEIFGRGLVVSNPHVRHCTQVLKIDPIQKYLRAKKYPIRLLSGMHVGESTARDIRLEKSSCGIAGNDCGNISTVERDGDTLYLPILEIPTCQIWDGIQEIEYLLDLPNDLLCYGLLKDSYILVNTTVNEGKALDSSLRTGCIGCPVISVKTHEKRDDVSDYSTKLALIYKEMYKNDDLRYISPKALKNGKLIYKKGKKRQTYITHGAYPIAVRKHYWQIILPILEKIKADTGVKMISEYERLSVESALKKEIFPQGYTPENLEFFHQEWLQRKPNFIKL
jgi:3'-phosphoadenosine 5'-phosphosulfate sulfotransferase (PAPS reductase)/FAD synthetase